jgi:diacylglycerol kinase family enzyme
LEISPVTYNLELDGQPAQARGILCTIANAAHLGILPALTLKPAIDITDGLLDVVVIDRVDLQNMIALLTRNLNSDSLGSLQHWQVRHALIQADPPQTTQVDGDSLGHTPITVISLPKALRVVVPL